MDAPEEVARRGAIDAGGLGELAGMPRKWARIQKTPKGMYSPMSGRMMASFVS